MDKALNIVGLLLVLAVTVPKRMHA